MVPTDCPPPANECEVATCNAGACGMDPLPNDTEIANQTVGDCLRQVCNGASMIVGVPDDTDVPDDGTLCTINGCSMGLPTSMFAPMGTACNDGGGEICDGNGQCAPSVCGDNIISGGEACDDGDLEDGDGCDSNCTVTACGNGVLTSGEVCDDGNTTTGDGCSGMCTVDADYQCTTEPAPSLCQLSETKCKNGVDDDGDGMIDGADADCALAADAPECGAGETLYVFNSTDVPKAVASLSSSDSHIAVTTGGTVQRAVVRLSIFHPFDADLDISLLSPMGTSVDLSSDNGADGDDYTATVFEDACAEPIAAGTAPFSGCFFPEQPLSALNGQNPDGLWMLHVADDTVEDDGALLEWSLALCVAP